MRQSVLGQFIFQAAKAVIAAVVFSLAAVLLFALVIKLFSVPSSAITVVTRIIKALAIAGGVILFVKDERGLLKGAAAGTLGAAVTYLIFAAIAGGKFSVLFLAELLFGAIIGGVAGIIAVNIRK